LKDVRQRWGATLTIDQLNEVKSLILSRSFTPVVLAGKGFLKWYMLFLF
jgi:hypothetical protein